jgi:hypothetical protein
VIRDDVPSEGIRLPGIAFGVCGCSYKPELLERGGGMPAYVISVRTERGFDVKIVGDNGSRQTMLGFPTREAAEAWIVEDQRRSQGEKESRF